MLTGEANSVLVSAVTEGNHLAFLATGSSGLAIVNVSQFTAPRVLSQLTLTGDSSDVDVDSVSNVAVIAANDGGLHFIDVSDSARPNRIRTADILASQVEAIDGVAYAAAGGQIVAYEALTGDLLNTFNVPDGANITGMTHEGGILYTMDANRNLSAFEVGDTGLVARGSVQLTHGGGQISVTNGIVYAAARPGFNQGGFATADVTNPSNLVELSASDVPGGIAVPGDVVVANGSGLALLGGLAASFPPATAIDVMDVRDPANTANFVTRFNLPVPPQGIAIASGIGYVADGTGGLQVINYVGFDTQGQAPTATITGPAGGNLQEGSIVPIRVSVTDDVQVRNVELLMNGQIVVNDVSAPFDLSAIAPTLANGAATVAFQVRATDTGGNVGLSNTLTYNLTSDITPPVLIGSGPTDDGAGFRVDTVTLRFNEPIDASRLSVDGVTLTNLGANSRLGGGDDSNITVTEIESPSPRRVVIHTEQPFGESRYQLTVNPSILADLAGNSVAAPVAITFTSFDAEVVNGIA